ncbi:MAG: L-histidine N(alpha)-methyltransferase [Bacteroidales bacterium]
MKATQEKETLSKIQFAKDVAKGLASHPKYLLSKYFYDERGDKLFQQIMNLEEYYLTDCEEEILNKYKGELSDIFQDSGKPFQLIELGAGDAVKTQILLRHLNKEYNNFTYIPIDISQHVLTVLEYNLSENFPELDVRPLHGEYFQALENLNSPDSKRKIILFLGSTIGNFTYNEALSFLKKLNVRMKKNEQIFIGFDLKKDPRVILNAYNDSYGITAEFNLNLLRRINNELGGNFKLGNFYHYPIYDPISGEAKSYLVSKQNQTIHIKHLNQTFSFEKGEPIHMEISKKYDIQEIDKLARDSGFKLKNSFMDRKKYFADVVIEKSKESNFA